jgi:uncharacterized protein YjbI with pentapeptide repeats
MSFVQDSVGLNGLSLPKADFRSREESLIAFECDLKASSFSMANLSGSSFHTSDLRFVTADNANLSMCTFSGCSLRSAVLSQADLRSAEITECDLRDADLSHAKLHGSVFESSFYNMRTSFPADFDPVAQGMHERNTPEEWDPLHTAADHREQDTLWNTEEGPGFH